MTKTLQTFLEIVQIDSPSGHEEKMGKYVTDWMDKHGFTVYQDTHGNILGTLKGQGKPLLLCGHLDTVQPGIGIKPQVADGVVKSDGNTILGADNKAALAAIMSAVDEYLASTPTPRALEVLFTVKEETGGGVEFFLPEKIQAKHGIIFDFAHPLGGIILSAPEITNFTITFTGKAAHARQPEKGVSVLPAVTQLLEMTQCGVLDDGQTTLNIGNVDVGTGANTVPAIATLHGEVRSTDHHAFQHYTDQLKAHAASLAHQFGLQTTWDTDGYCPGYVFAEQNPFVQWAATTMQSLGLSPDMQKQYGVSDANILNHWGVQTLTLADGVRHPHTLEEEISVNDLKVLHLLTLKLLSDFSSETL
jgi:tripeptide aminopeptidase